MKIDGEVLVVEAEPLVAELIVHRLNEAGYRARSVADGEEAMRFVQSPDRSVDVVLIGARLPDGSGLELVKRMRGDPNTCAASIALLTVLRDRDEVLRAIEAGADDCLRKPIDRAELLARVRSLFRIKRQMDELRQTNEKLQELNRQLGLSAASDPLTRLANRRAFESRLEDEIERARRYHQPLSLLVLDLDHFKAINDTYGHAAGDEVLKAVASSLGRSIRKVDLAARYGGEEFVVIVPMTPAAGALVLAERLRALVAEERVTVSTEGGAQSIAVTVSIGVAALESGQGAEAFFTAADGALYSAKHGGRNRVVVAGNGEQNAVAETSPGQP